MRREFMAVRHGDDAGEVVAEARKKRIDLIPLLDVDGYITKIYDLRILKSVLPIDAVLMAGGKGERLRPLTLATPKPLLKVGGKAIIDYNVERLKECGVENIFVTVNYLHEQIEEHFRGDKAVTCILEPCRLGTLGSLSLIDDLRHDNILLMNSDLLTTIDFEAMFRHHLDAEADMTVATIPYTVSVPFAILETEGDKVKALVEKPTYNYLANAGVYILKRSLVCRIPRGEYLDTPDFMERVMKEGGKVAHFPVNGTWIDIGSPDDFRFANEVVRNKGLNG